jgi:hypothetical protein
MSFVDSKRRTFPIATDLTNFQYYVAKLDSTGKVTPSTAATDKHVGVIETNPSSTSDYAVVRMLQGDGTYHVIAGGTIAVGDLLTANSSSQAVATTTGGDQLIGQAIHAAATGDLVEFLPFRAKY